MNADILCRAESYVKQLFSREFSGHDYFHTFRVYRMAQRLALREGADLLTVQLAALLHDVDDHKLSPETWVEKRRARSFLLQNGATEEEITQIIDIICEISFMGADSIVPASLEGRCVQDADRLDAIGAIGAARAFAFGGSRHRVMHDPEIPPLLNMDADTYRKHESTTINHFYEKLLLLPALMTTSSGKQMAEHRGAFLQMFLDEFLAEWEGEK